MATLSLMVPLVASAKPPANAPAHGYRAKQAQKHPAPPTVKGLEVVFDEGLGIHIAVGLPGVFFHDGHYYQERDGRWQVSLNGEGGWSFSTSSAVPDVVRKAKKPHPRPAKKAKSRRKKGK
jgi:hypothetical protein